MHSTFQAEADLMEQERAIEMEMSGPGFAKFQEALKEAQEAGQETSTPGARFAMQSAIGPVAEKVQAILKDQKTREGNVRPYLRKIPSEIIAFITSKLILDRGNKPRPRTNIAMAVGRALEEECYLRALEAEYPRIFRIVQSSLSHTMLNREVRRWHVANECAATPSGWQDWPEEHKLHVGQHCIEFFMQTTGLVKPTTVTVGKDSHETRGLPASVILATATSSF
jgi:DNA-directed RNA polymerase